MHLSGDATPSKDECTKVYENPMVGPSCRLSAPQEYEWSG